MRGEGAVLSDCERYRYTLTRDGWMGRGEGTCLFVMLNPSTADASEDDPTIRRCIGFAQSWGFDRLGVVNLFGLRSTDPEGLLAADDPVGPDNDHWIEQSATGPHAFVVAAWGAHPAAAERVAQVFDVFARTNSRIYCLGTTKEGHPRHPLYVPAVTKPIPLPPPSTSGKDGA